MFTVLSFFLIVTFIFAVIIAIREYACSGDLEDVLIAFFISIGVGTVVSILLVAFCALIAYGVGITVF